MIPSVPSPQNDTTGSPQNGTAPCEGDWREHAGVCYLLITSPRSFDSAESFCRESSPGLSASLAAVTDYAGLASVLPLENINFFWVGLKSTPEEDGKLYWRTHPPVEVTATYWRSLQYADTDDERFGPENDCVMVNGLRFGVLYTADEWADYVCHFEFRYLCQLRL